MNWYKKANEENNIFTFQPQISPKEKLKKMQKQHWDYKTEDIITEFQDEE